MSARTVNHKQRETKDPSFGKVNYRKLQITVVERKLREEIYYTKYWLILLVFYYN